ncbi:MAG TPA: hypothetical protein VH061_02060 [Solirubrobacteraceae bacterium]|nr:hypothetical protein [Solirubrobacteraceae bacterium]
MGAAVATGVPVSSLGALHGLRLALAFACIAAVFVAIFVIVTSAVPLMSPVRGSYKEFADPKFGLLHSDLEKDPEPLDEKATSAAGLVEAYESAKVTQGSAWQLYSTTPPADPTAPRARADYEKAKNEFDQLEALLVTVTWLGLYLHTKERFEQVRRKVYRAVVVVAAGSVAFAYFANPPARASSDPEPKIAVTVNQSQNCAGLYLTLDELAHRSPQLHGHWPAADLGKQANKCGFANKQQLDSFLQLLARR